jgi:hypothetical protein
MDSLAFLGSASRKLQPIYVLHGDESFLKRQVLAALRARVFGADGDEFGYSAQRLTYHYSACLVIRAGRSVPENAKLLPRGFIPQDRRLVP